MNCFYDDVSTAFPNIRHLTVVCDGLFLEDAMLHPLGANLQLEYLVLVGFRRLTGDFLKDCRFRDLRSVEFRGCPDVVRDVLVSAKRDQPTLASCDIRVYQNRDGDEDMYVV